MAEQNFTKRNKAAMLKALEQTLGVVTPALKSTGVGRATFYGWLKTDQKFNDAVNSMPEIAIDFAESHLHKQIKDGVPSSTIFFLKTKGKRRGYVEKVEHEHSGNLTFQPNIDFGDTSEKDADKQ